MAQPNRIHLDCTNVTLHSSSPLLSPTAPVLIKIYPDAFWLSAQGVWHTAMRFIGGWDLWRISANSSLCDWGRGVAIFAKSLHASAVLSVQGGFAYIFFSFLFCVFCVDYTGEVRSIVPWTQNYSYRIFSPIFCLKFTV